MRTGKNRKTDPVGVFLNRGLHDLLGRLEKARVNHFHPGVAQGACDDLRATIVAVQARFSDDDA